MPVEASIHPAKEEGTTLARRSALARKPANGAGWRLFVATLALIAFAFQSYITQTHIHLSPPTAIGLSKLATTGTRTAKAAKASGTAEHNNKAPTTDEPMKCPLCQAVGYAGHFVTPSQTALLLPTSAISILPVAIFILSPRERPSHIWQGRGPPSF